MGKVRENEAHDAAGDADSSRHEVRDFHAISPTSQMFDTVPHAFEPVNVGGAHERPTTAEEEALLAAPTSQTLRFAGDQNPAAAFSREPPRAPPPRAPLEALLPRGSVVTERTILPRERRAPKLLAIVLLSAFGGAVLALAAGYQVVKMCHDPANKLAICSALR